MAEEVMTDMTEVVVVVMAGRLNTSLHAVYLVSLLASTLMNY